MPRLLPLVVALAIVTAWLPAEEPATTPATTGVTEQGISATTSGRANVRYGPNKNARIACTLDAGTPIEILGPAKVADWFVIRFPQQGKAWVHSKNLQAIDGGKRWKVTADDTKARADSTLKADIVAEMSAGEVIEDRNSLRGDWHAVYIPSAVAYIHKSLINLPDANALKLQQDQAVKLEALWNDAQTTYAQLYRQLQDKPDSAVGIDWSNLLDQLDQVAKSHPNAAVRQSAQRIHDGIEVVAEKSKAVRDQKGITTPTTPVGTPVSGPVTTAEPPTHVIETGEPSLHVPPGKSDPDAKPLPAPHPTDTPSAGSYLAVGFVCDNTDYPKVGAPSLLLDSNSNVVAFLTAKPGTTVNFGEYFYRWVGVQGERKAIDQTLHGLGKDIPMIQVDSVHLVKQ